MIDPRWSWHTPGMRQALLITVLLTTAFACDSGDDSGDSDDVASETESDSTDSANTEGETSAEDPWDFPPVECGEGTCAQGMLCVVPSKWCDYGQHPPVWVEPAAECKPVPQSCVDLEGYPLDECLWETVCGSSGLSDYLNTLDQGTYVCPPEGLDCFE